MMSRFYDVTKMVQSMNIIIDKEQIEIGKLSSTGTITGLLFETFLKSPIIHGLSKMTTKLELK